MKTIAISLAILTLSLMGCDIQATATNDNTTGDVATESTVLDDSSTRATLSAPAADSVNADDTSTPAAGDAPSETHTIAITPENTKIQFVGTHVGDDPRPRTGTFQQFAGEATISGNQLTAVQVQIETASITTEIDRLTNHLKSPDFFEVREYPQATFTTTSIEPTGDGQVTITGDLTLREQTRPITFPATVSTEKGLLLNAEFTINRMEFGIDHSPEGVEEEVALTIEVDGQ